MRRPSPSTVLWWLVATLAVAVSALMVDQTFAPPHPRPPIFGPQPSFP